jgi:protein TonB
MATEPTLIPRFEERRRAYRRVLERASLISAGIHLAAALALNPEPLLRLFAPNVDLGFEGSSRRGALAPPGRESDRRFSLVSERGYRTPVRLVRPVVLGTPAGTAPAAPPATNLAGRPVPGDAPYGESKLRPTTGPVGAAVQFELDESWASIPGSGRVAQSEKFQILSIKRPNYPRVALREGIQGLVRLEVQVNVEGKVSEVRVIDSPQGSQDLVEAAVEAMYQWRFRPFATQAGPTPFTVLVPFRFRLIS